MFMYLFRPLPSPNGSACMRRVREPAGQAGVNAPHVDATRREGTGPTTTGDTPIVIQCTTPRHNLFATFPRRQRGEKVPMSANGGLCSRRRVLFAHVLPRFAKVAQPLCVNRA